MAPLNFIVTVLTCLCYWAPAAAALTERVLSTFIYTHHGERTPRIWQENPSLTPLGARQAYQAGVNFRGRYIQQSGNPTETSFVVREISQVFLENRQVNILSSPDEWVVASAQAFMQGLYPPLGEGWNYTTIAGESDLANGTNVIGPLNGYQYPNIAAASPYDLRSIYVRGADNCPLYRSAADNYFNTSRYEYLRQSSQSFYDSLREPLLKGVFDDSAVGFWNAYYIWDYLNYAYVHNITVARRLSAGDAARAQVYAGNWMFDEYANITEDGKLGSQHIRAIAGRSLAYYIQSAFLTSIQSRGRYNKVNLVFGDYIPMMSFFAAMELMTERTSTFFSAPLPGSSFIFELYTLQDGTDSDQYPRSSDMYVRFLYQNSTESAFRPVEYPLFGHSPGMSVMAWADFVAAMSVVMISGVEDWCTTCGSSAVFCQAQSGANRGGSSNRLAPAIAGVIGAIVALVFIALVTGLVMFFGGVRLYRHRKSELGGFKGNEKLASDQDLTIPKGGAGVSVQEEPRGHERVGSWELKEPVSLQKTHSGIDTAAFGRPGHALDNDDTMTDPYAIPVKPRDAF